MKAFTFIEMLFELQLIVMSMVADICGCQAGFWELYPSPGLFRYIIVVVFG
jgi:hypothetical protein